MPENNLLDELVQQLNSTSQTIDASSMTNIDRLKVAICGEPKTGKSYVIAKTCRKPLLHFDFDDRRDSIAGIPDTIIKTLVDKQDDNPVAWNILESDIGTLEYAKSQGKLAFKSIAIDSVTFLRKYAEHQFLKDSTGTTRNKFRIGSTNYLIPKDWDAVTGVQKMLESMFSRLFALDIDIYATFHTRPEKDMQKSSKTDIVYKDTLTVDPPNLKMLLPKFNDQWRTFFDDGKYQVQLKPDWRFNAATVLKNVNEIEVADIEKLLEKHKNGTK